MIESGYSKLFSSIVTSTIWREDDKTRIVWITLLALKNRFGQVAGALPGLAAMANVSIEDCAKAIEKLTAPDPYSRTKEFDGRRVDVIEGGWLVLNHAKYRNAMSEDERRAYKRDWDRRKRKKIKDNGSCGQSCGHSDVLLTHTDADAVPPIGSPPPVDKADVLVDGPRPAARKAGKADKVQRIQDSQELSRIATELRNYSQNANDYPKESKTHKRILLLRARQGALRSALGVVA